LEPNHKYTAYVTPFDVAFLETKLNFMFALNCTVDFCFLVDMIKCFFTSYFDADAQMWVVDLADIRSRYLKSWFAIDFVSILPFDAIGLTMDSDSMTQARLIRLIRLMRLLKLLRLLRGVRIFERWQDEIGITYAARNLVKFAIMVVTLIHWMGCGLRLLPDLLTHRDPSGTLINWLESTHSNGLPLASSTPSRQYAIAMYWAAMTLTTIGYGDVPATNTSEAVFMTICMVFSSGVYAYTIGEVGETNLGTSHLRMWLFHENM
jgi:potassium voltage-gated channel Eag-related subfamily H protein 7